MGNNSAFKLKFGFFSLYVQRLLILTLLSLIISLMLFPSIFSKPKSFKLNEVAETDIKASHDILIENKELTEQKREQAVKEVLYVYDVDPLVSDLIFRLKQNMAEARDFFAVTEDKESAPEAEESPDRIEERELLKSSFFKSIEIASDDNLFERLTQNNFSPELEDNIVNLLDQVFKQGVVGNKDVLMTQSQKGIHLQSIQTQDQNLVKDLERFYDVESAKESIESQRTDLKKIATSTKLANLSVDIALAMVRPNVTFNQRETEKRKNAARESISPIYNKIKKGEMLVRDGEIINASHLIKLQAEIESSGRIGMLGRVPGMAVLVGFLLSVVYALGLIKYGLKGDEGKDLLFNALILLGIFVFFWAYNFIAVEIARGFYAFTSTALLFAMPVACGAMLITVFQGIGTATTFALIISVFASLLVEGRVEFFIFFFISSLLSVHGVRDYLGRGILIKTGLKVGLINIILCLAIESIYGSFYSIEALVAIIAGFAGGFFSGVIATGIIPLVEMSFGFTTNIKLLELANLDQPLLKDQMVQAPGTHHHSMIVSNMVEACAESVGANPLLAKVAAYYHDIGKMKKPIYFIENQMGRENKHEKLAPSMSSLVLISHVKDGVELAKEHKLGREIIDIIQQHHGKGLISYFYKKAREQAVSKGSKSAIIKEEGFRYPGPKPQTKEACLVMLADMSEAASRSLVDPTPARIQGMVQKIINMSFSDGQLDECELTLKDLHEIAKSFNKTLGGIFHHRIEYPEMSTKTEKRVTNGDSDHDSPEDTRSSEAEDRGDDREGLKRLGL
ncbi:MAG: HDIG domain-containing protein [Deltaproteobacteria bacterium]|nr:HDIG domain-containing protein [Deltaproteobacteria bacterium]